MNIRIGTSPDSWGIWNANDTHQIPWPQFLDEVVTAGYQSIELGPFGYLPTDPLILSSELETRGLNVCAGFVIGNLEDGSEFVSLEQRVLDTGGLVAALGGDFLVLIDDLYCDLFSGELLLPSRLDSDAWKRLIDNTNRLAYATRERLGLQTVFHPHVGTHVEHEDQIEAFLAQTDPQTVNLCFDTGHHAFYGYDPICFLDRNHSRIKYLHLKNVDPNIQREITRGQLPFATAVARGIFCEPSLGIVDFLTLKDVLRKIDYSGWAIVEQDMHPAPPGMPLPIATRTRKYLHDIGIG